MVSLNVSQCIEIESWKMITIPQYNEPLPQCEDPKLGPFHNPKPAVTFRRLLSDKDAEGHAHVFEAAIDPITYAVKMVRVLSDVRYRDRC